MTKPNKIEELEADCKELREAQKKNNADFLAGKLTREHAIVDYQQKRNIIHLLKLEHAMVIGK